MLKTLHNRLLENVNHESSKRKNPFYQAVEKVVRSAVAWRTVNEIKHINLYIFVESQDLLHYIRCNSFENPSFAGPITHFMKQYAPFAIADESMFNDHNTGQV